MKIIEAAIGQNQHNCKFKGTDFPAALHMTMYFVDIEVGPWPIIFISLNECPLKVMKSAFNLTLKTLFILRKFQFFSWLFDHIDKATWSKTQG